MQSVNGIFLTEYGGSWQEKANSGQRDGSVR
jgi:hypothetical protein